MAENSQSPSLQTVVAKGMAWTGLVQLITHILSLVTTVILVRFLLPADFGLVAMANVFIGLGHIVNDFGLGVAIIQKPQLEDRHLNSVFVANICLGVILFLLSIIAAPVVASFYNNPDAQPIVSVLAFAFLINSLGAVQSAIFSKKMRYKAIAMIGLVSTLVQTSVAIFLAVQDMGSWALVFSALIGSLASVIGFWVGADWYPRLKFDRQAFGELFAFGANVVGSSITGYTSGSVDNLMIGKFLGATSLGYYDIAFRWATLPRQRLVGIIHQVTFPAFSTVQDNNIRLQSGYVKLLSYISFITFPMSAGLIIIAPKLIPLIYTEQWIPAIIPLQILSLGGMISTIGSPMGLILKAKGRPDLEFKMTIFSVLLLIILLIIGLQFQLIGVAVAVTLKSLILIWVFGSMTNRLIDLKFSTYVGAFMPATVAVLIMLVVLWPLQVVLDSHTGLTYLNHIIIITFAGASIYILAIKLLNPPQWSDLIILMVNTIPRFPYSNIILPLFKQILS